MREDTTEGERKGEGMQGERYEGSEMVFRRGREGRGGRERSERGGRDAGRQCC